MMIHSNTYENVFNPMDDIPMGVLYYLVLNERLYMTVARFTRDEVREHGLVCPGCGKAHPGEYEGVIIVRPGSGEDEAVSRAAARPFGEDVLGLVDGLHITPDDYRAN